MEKKLVGSLASKLLFGVRSSTATTTISANTAIIQQENKQPNVNQKSKEEMVIKKDEKVNATSSSITVKSIPTLSNIPAVSQKQVPVPTKIIPKPTVVELPDFLEEDIETDDELQEVQEEVVNANNNEPETEILLTAAQLTELEKN